MQQRRFGPPPGGGHGGREPPSMPAARAVRYFNASGALSAELVNEEAETVARNIAAMNSSQLRRFYDDVKAIERRVMRGRDLAEMDSLFEREQASIAMMKANAAYGHRRSSKTVPREFLQFIIDHVAAVKTIKDFRAFLKHFEAVVAFHRFYSDEKG